MLDWFWSVNSILRELRKKAIEAHTHLGEGNTTAATVVQNYLKSDYEALRQAWAGRGFDTAEFGGLGRHISFGQKHDYDDIIQRDIPAVEIRAEQHVREEEAVECFVGLEHLLHPVVIQHAYQQYRDGHLRDAVLNAIVAVFDLIRQRTGLKNDGQGLVSEAFSLDKPKLIFSDLTTDSGRNDQKGFIQILTGAYTGIRNPKAHSLHHDLDNTKAAQYLVFASLLARRVSDAHED